jgi:hypothetical protein
VGKRYREMFPGVDPVSLLEALNMLTDQGGEAKDPPLGMNVVHTEKDDPLLKPPVDIRDTPDKPSDVLPDDPWAHRAAGMRCSTCVSYVEKLNHSGAASLTIYPVIGRCRKHAPTLNGYPVVYPTDWCGDHKLDETKL